ncbi:MAG: SDR family oxidoreductase [Hyphomonadaceae bacterium]|nr:MAG: dTDP-4-dehydrorhamnose reductase [Caulobacteraceae bacterium]MBT9446255.1 SDR family oxidoreductase [Hyphomonadaceae bacterium]TPW07166.1 MAG: dTDP-4-dehydrorhamnose reductase [Alphaproteobacteria bacterium]
MRVLVLGGYGLIGLEIVRRLRADGLDVTGLGRSAAKGRRAAPDVDWIGADIATLTTPESWRAHLAGIDAVVNASGALQDGLRDNLAAVQDEAIRALIGACAEYGVHRFVQISAPGADAAGETAFMRTKGVADDALKASALRWTIFKPGLVISANAYGGTQLLRMLAAFPVVQPLVLGDARIQTVAADDVADAVSFALMHEQTTVHRTFDLVERGSHRLRDVVAAFRAWLGIVAAKRRLELPAAFGFAIAHLADLAGWLGWRSPLRTTALRVLARDVAGDASTWEAVRGRALKSLDETLRALPATLQERVSARAGLVFPALVMTLSAFWLASSLIGLWQTDAAARVLGGAVTPAMAMTLVFVGSALDLCIGAGLLVRRFTRAAARASIVVSLGYLASGTWLTPHLWADPLGPFVKIFPAMALALAVAALAEER